MQKVVFTVSKVNREEKQKGIGYLVEGNLLIPSVSSKDACGHNILYYVSLIQSIL